MPTSRNKLRHYACLIAVSLQNSLNLIGNIYGFICVLALDYLFRVHYQEADTKFWPDKKTVRANLARAMRGGQPRRVRALLLGHVPSLQRAILWRPDSGELKWTAQNPGRKQGATMLGYTVPGTMFSTITINKSALFRAHADGNNLPGALACLAAFGDFAGGDLCFPRFGVACPIEPGDLLIGDNAFEQHGNIGPLSGERISIVAYMRDEFAK